MAARADDLEEEARQLAQKAAGLRGAADSVRKGNEGEMLVGERLDGSTAQVGASCTIAERA